MITLTCRIAVFKQESGICSTEEYEPELGIISKKYPKAAKLNDSRIRQEYVNDGVFSLGIEEKNVDGIIVRLYNVERMLIELLRHKNKLPYDHYKEMLLNYRERINNMEIQKIQEYVEVFPKRKMISLLSDITVEES